MFFLLHVFKICTKYNSESDIDKIVPSNPHWRCTCFSPVAHLFISLKRQTVCRAGDHYLLPSAAQQARLFMPRLYVGGELGSGTCSPRGFTVFQEKKKKKTHASELKQYEAVKKTRYRSCQ